MPVPCSTLTDPGCIVSRISGDLGGVAASAASGAVDNLAAAIRGGITWLLAHSVSLWLRLPSPDLGNEPAIGAMRQWLLPITAAVAVGAMIAAGARMVLTRRANPLLDVGGGLVTIAAVASLGVIVPGLLLQAGDEWTNWILQVSTGGAYTRRMNDLLTFAGAPSVIVVVLGIAGLLLVAVQAALLMFRQAAVVLLAALLPLAAAGSIAPLTRGWIRKIISWMLALIAYKPAAGCVYAVAFSMIGSGSNVQTMLMGFVMLALSLVALPVLMRFFTWTTGAVTSGGGGGQLMGMAAAGAVAVGAMRAGGASASDHATYMNPGQTPPSAEGPQGPSGGTPGSSPGSGGGAGQPAAPAAAPQAAAAGAATAGAAGAAAAVIAAQGLASGARGAAGSATEEGERT
jgi:hypothetical protein